MATDLPAPVVVTPKPLSQSRTIRAASVFAALGAMLAILPQFISDPAVVTWMHSNLSDGARDTIGSIAVAAGLYFAYLRAVTVAPIAGTAAAISLPESTEKTA